MASKNKEISGKETEVLLKELGEQQRRLFDLRTQAVTEKLEDPTQLRKARIHIARIRTALRSRELQAAAKPAEAPAAK